MVVRVLVATLKLYLGAGEQPTFEHAPSPRQPQCGLFFTGHKVSLDSLLGGKDVESKELE